MANQTNKTASKIEALKSGAVSALHNVKTYLDRIKKENQELNIFLYIAEQEAMARAIELDRKREAGKSLGKLFGLCIGIKSNIAVQGMPLSCASATLQDFIAPYDSDVIAKIKQEDGIILGMLNMDEFASGSSGESSHFGPAKNPAAKDRIPGGSSSGSAAAVAAGLCDLALGSDTGGSIRNPASHCGVVGVKPSYGRVSRYGLVDLAMSLDQIGTIAPDAYGAELLLHAIAGPSKNDARTIDSEKINPKRSKPEGNIRVGICTELQELCTDKRVRDAVGEAANLLAANLGDLHNPKKEPGGEENSASSASSPKKISLKHVHLAVQTYYPLVYVEFFSGTRKFDGRKYGKNIDEAAGEEVRRRIAGGREISKAEYAGKYYRTALGLKSIMKEEIDSAFGEVDILVSPVTPMLPHKLGSRITTEQMYAYDAFTIPANLAGCCAASIPLAKIDGIPVGLHLMCKPFSEDILFRAMKAWERLSIDR